MNGQRIVCNAIKTLNPDECTEKGTRDQVLGVRTGRRMAQPEADRRPLRLRAMPPGRLRWKRQDPRHAGCRNDRVDPCGRVRRLRGAVVGETAIYENCP